MVPKSNVMLSLRGAGRLPLLGDHPARRSAPRLTLNTKMELEPHTRVVASGCGNIWCLMGSIYERFASDCVRLAAKSTDKSTRAELYRLAQQWQMMDAEAQGEVGKSAHRPAPALHAPERR
jgi:hypothetical protein